MSIAITLEKKLTDAFHPLYLEIINESHKHKGHQGSPETGESHFKIVIDSKEFQGLSRVATHQRIYQCLEEELKTKIHALSIVIGQY